jgi:hypothetical protein
VRKVDLARALEVGVLLGGPRLQALESGSARQEEYMRPQEKVREMLDYLKKLRDGAVPDVEPPSYVNEQINCLEWVLGDSEIFDPNY